MSLFYVTGISGTGKSQVLKELQARDYEAHGTDEHGFANWVNKSSREIEMLQKTSLNLIFTNGLQSMIGY